MQEKETAVEESELPIKAPCVQGTHGNLNIQHVYDASSVTDIRATIHFLLLNLQTIKKTQSK